MGISRYITLLLLIIRLSQSQPPKYEDLTIVEQTEFTMDNSIPIAHFYVDDTDSGKSTHYKYSESSIEKLVQTVKKRIGQLATSQVLWNRNGVLTLHRNEWLYGYLANHTNIENKNHLLSNKKVLVVGSSHPWVEAIAIAYDALHVTTVEYNKLTYENISFGIYSKTRINTVSSEGFDHFYSQSVDSYDVAFSVSSFDHSGLGRYGDGIDPNGDLKSMSLVMQVLKPGGILFLTVPIGPDVTVWNLHRRYGRVRLPLLIKGWELVDRFAWTEDMLDTEANWRQTYEPVFVLRKPFEKSELLSNGIKSGKTKKEAPDL